jgi:hypothetical protein
MREKIFALSLGFGALILATQAQAQYQAAQCGPRIEMVAQLADDLPVKGEPA